MTDTDLAREAAIRTRLCKILMDIVDKPIDPSELSDHTLLAYDLGLDSIEFVALLELVQRELGVPFSDFVDGPGAQQLRQLLDQLSVRWVIDRALKV